MSGSSWSSEFTHFARAISRQAGRPGAFLGAVMVILTWAVSGPAFGFSDTWQLVINTGTTIVTFLMVFLIQNAQNRDAEAIQLKLDELIRAIDGAQNSMLGLEELEEEQLALLHQRYLKLSQEASQVLESKSRKAGR